MASWGVNQKQILMRCLLTLMISSLDAQRSLSEFQSHKDTATHICRRSHKTICVIGGLTEGCLNQKDTSMMSVYTIWVTATSYLAVSVLFPRSFEA